MQSIRNYITKIYQDGDSCIEAFRIVGKEPRIEMVETCSNQPGKSVTKICRTGLDKCVWTLGQDAGTAMLTCPASNGVVFSYAGRQWRSNQHPQLTLAEVGFSGIPGS